VRQNCCVKSSDRTRVTKFKTKHMQKVVLNITRKMNFCGELRKSDVPHNAFIPDDCKFRTRGRKDFPREVQFQNTIPVPLVTMYILFIGVFSLYT